MKKTPIAMPVAALVATLVVANAQASVPTREGNIWNWKDHEPVPSQVIPDERAAGVSQTPRDQRETTDEVEKLYQEIMRNARSSANPPAI